MEEKFDVVIVGGGPSGLTAAYFLAEAGLNVLILEKGKELGNKNMYGGRIYSHVLSNIFPDFSKSAPIERWVRKERIVLMDEKSAIAVEYIKDDELTRNSFTAYLTKFVQWLGKKAEDAGALIATDVRVDELLIEDGYVKGVIAGDEKVLADYTIVAEGANTLLLEKAGLKNKTEPHEVALGVKEVIKLDADTINTRFGVNSDEGVATLLVGYPSKGMIGGGFLYTMKNEISLGIVVNLSEPARHKIKMHELIEEFRMHPYIKSLVKDGYMVEYSAHFIIERGALPSDKLYGNGYIVVGDAAGFELNTGLTVRGVDFAIESGKIAAETIIEAHKKGKNDKTSLAIYVDRLKKSFVLRELKAFRRAPKFLANRRLYSVYPSIMINFFREIYSVDGQPRRIYSTLRKSMRKKISLFTIIKDLIGAVRSL